MSTDEYMQRAATEWLETVDIIRQALYAGVNAEAIVARLAHADYILVKSADVVYRSELEQVGWWGVGNRFSMGGSRIFDVDDNPSQHADDVADPDLQPLYRLDAS